MKKKKTEEPGLILCVRIEWAECIFTGQPVVLIDGVDTRRN